MRTRQNLRQVSPKHRQGAVAGVGYATDIGPQRLPATATGGGPFERVPTIGLLQQRSPLALAVEVRQVSTFIGGLFAGALFDNLRQLSPPQTSTMPFAISIARRRRNSLLFVTGR